MTYHPNELNECPYCDAEIPEDCDCCEDVDGIRCDEHEKEEMEEGVE